MPAAQTANVMSLSFYRATTAAMIITIKIIIHCVFHLYKNVGILWFSHLPFALLRDTPTTRHTLYLTFLWDLRTQSHKSEESPSEKVSALPLHTPG